MDERGMIMRFVNYFWMDMDQGNNEHPEAYPNQERGPHCRGQVDSVPRATHMGYPSTHVNSGQFKTRNRIRLRVGALSISL